MKSEASHIPWAAQAERLESLGDNCEFGFATRKLGFENSSLFRWAAMAPRSLLALLINDFRAFYQFDNLMPHRLDMILETTYLIGWHSVFKCRHEGRELVFIASDEERRRLFPGERRKLEYLHTKFLARLRAGGCIYFLKCNTGISAPVIECVKCELERLADGAAFWLVHVKRAAEGPPGTQPGDLTTVSHNRFEAFVGEFAAYTSANKYDRDAWETILERVFALAPYPTWQKSVEFVNSELLKLRRVLPFIEQNPQGDDCRQETSNGIRVRLDNDHPWSRQLNETTFRLHTTGNGARASQLTWSDIRLDRPAEFHLIIRAAVDDSLPVGIECRIADQKTNEILSKACAIVTPTEPYLGVIRAAASEDAVCEFSIRASAERSLRMANAQSSTSNESKSAAARLCRLSAHRRRLEDRMEIEGAIDGYSLEPFALGGWARSIAGKPLYIEARCDDRTIAGTATHILRPDLGGAHGFRLEIPGEDLVNCKGVVSGRLAIFAVTPQGEQALPIYHILERNLLVMMLTASVRPLPASEKAAFVAWFLREIGAETVQRA